MIISLQLFNLGDSDATDVIVNDVWPEFQITQGLDSVSWEQVPAGANYSHTFVIIPQKSGEYKVRRGSVFYRDDKGVEYETLSNEPYPLRIYELNEVDKRSGAHVFEWLVFLVLCLLFTGAPAAMYGYISIYYSHGVLVEPSQQPLKGSKKNKAD